jgi:two-component system LytT family response regulator
MNFEHTSSNETRESLPNNDPHLHEVAKVIREELRQPLERVASASAHHEHESATLGNKSADEAVTAFSNERNRKPLTGALRPTAAGRAVSPIKVLSQLPTHARGSSARIGIKAKGRILLIDPADVIAVEAKGNYVLLQHASSPHMLRESISTMEEKLSPHGFVRIHRSVLVNAALVEEIHPWSTGEYMLRVRGGREYTVTRTYRQNLRCLAQSWIGIDGFVAD